MIVRLAWWQLLMVALLAAITGASVTPAHAIAELVTPTAALIPVASPTIVYDTTMASPTALATQIAQTLPTAVATARPAILVEGTPTATTSPTTIASPTATTSPTAITTPTATTSPTAIASPTPSATVTGVPTSVAILTRSVLARVFQRPDTCATTLVNPTEACPVTMKAVVATPPAGDTAFRVGDVVRVDVTLTSTRSVSLNGVAVALDYPATKLELVTGQSDPTPIALTQTGVEVSAVADIASGAFGPAATVFRNRHAVTYVAGVGLVGQVDLEAGVALPADGPASAVTVNPGANVVIASIYVRVLDNPAGDQSFVINLFDSANVGRRAIVSDASTISTVGRNLLGPVVAGTIRVAQTRATLALAVVTPAAGTVRRIGDVVAVHLTINPETAVRNATTVRASVGFSLADLALVGIPALASTEPPSPISVGTTAGVASSTYGLLGASAAVDVAYAATNTTGTIAIAVTGAPLALVANAGPKVVATFYVRPRHRGGLDLSLSAPVVGRPSGSNLAWFVTTAATPTATVADVRGTVGVGLAATVPAATADGSAPSLTAGVDNLAVAAGATVVAGRALDVEVSALAGQTDAARADRFVIDITFDPDTLDVPSTPNIGTDLAFADGFIADGTAAVTAPGTLRLRVKRESNTQLAASAPIARVRFTAKTPASNAAASATFALGVGTTSEVTQAGGTLFVQNLYDNVRDASSLDRLPTVARQKTSSMAVNVALQGRATADPDSRFREDVRFTLRPAGGAVSPIRRYQPQVPVTVATSGVPAIPVVDMRYVGATARRLGTAVATVSLPDLEPGTYDVYLRGRTSLTVKIVGIVLAPGVTTGIPDNSGAVELPEGDADQSDAINGADFATLARTFGTSDARADFNQSGYVDAYDFALLARNYGLAGPVALATLAVAPALPSTLVIGAATVTRVVTLDAPPGLVLDRVRVVVTGSSALPVTCPPAGAVPAGTSCVAETDTRVRLEVSGGGGVGPGGRVTVGAFNLAGASTGAMNVTVSVVDAVGHAPSIATTPVTVRAAALGSVVAVAPSATYRLVVASVSNGAATARVDLTVADGVHATSGRVTLTYDAALVVAEPTCTGLPVGVTCDTAIVGRVTFTIDQSAADLTGSVGGGLGTVTLRARPGVAGSASVGASVDDLADTVVKPGYRTRLVVAAAEAGADVAVVAVANGAVTAQTVAADSGSVGVATVHGRAVGPSGVTASEALSGRGATSSGSVPTPALIDVSSANDGVVARGDIVPVTLRISTGLGAVDAMQAVVAVAPGFEIAGADGAAVSPGADIAVDVLPASPWPVTLRGRVDATGRNIEVAFGRQVGGSLAGWVGDGAVATVFLRATAQATSGVAATVLNANSGSAFTSALVGADGAVNFVGGAAVVRIDPAAPSGRSRVPALNAPPTAVEVAVTPWSSVPTAVEAPKTVPSNGAGPSNMRAVSSLYQYSDAGTQGASSVPTVGVRPPTTRWHEDSVQGVIHLELSGEGGAARTTSVATGFATTEGDAWCPGPRYRTYVRLEDVGVAGATFGVGAGGVLDWVTPDQSGCVDWGAIQRDGLTFSKEAIMQFRLARAAPGALLWVQDGVRLGELFEVGADGVAGHVTDEVFAANQDHYREVWANVIPVSTAQVADLAARGMVAR